MVRQAWIFLLPEDEAGLLAAIDAVDPGTWVLGGRYLDGDPGRVLACGPEGLSFPSLGEREVRRYVLHRRHSRELTTHPVQEGPLAGGRWIDETRSDCLMLVRPVPGGSRLAPATLSAVVSRTAGAQRVKRPHAFVGWATRVLKAVAAQYPRTSVDFLHVAPAAEAFARAGGTLEYLHQRVEIGPPGAG